MNQILNTEPSKSSKISSISYCKNKNNKYQLQFIVSFCIATFLCLFSFIKIAKASLQEKVSKKLLNSYNLTTVYQTQTSVNIPSKEPFVIGILKIDKININYPVLSKTSDDLLKISLCRFAGPMPNKNGNLCIVGHNYIDNRFFGNLEKLSIRR